MVESDAESVGHVPTRQFVAVQGGDTRVHWLKAAIDTEQKAERQPVGTRTAVYAKLHGPSTILWHTRCVVRPAQQSGRQVTAATMPRETTLKLDRRRVLTGFVAAGFVALVSPSLVRAGDDDDDPRDYRNGSGYRNNHENRPNGNPHLNNVTDQPGMSYQQSVEAGGESRETVHESAIKPVHYWLTEAMSGNATEIEAGRLAQERGSSQ